MIKVLVKEPGKSAALREIEGDLKTMQAIVGGYIEIVTINHNPDILLVCNEEGKLEGLEANFPFNGDSFVGTVFFARGDDEREIIGLEDGDLGRIIHGLTGIEVETPVKESNLKRYIDDRGWTYHVRAGIGKNCFKAFYCKPDKTPWPRERAYRNTPWRETANQAQEDLDKLAREKGWKVTNGR